MKTNAKKYSFPTQEEIVNIGEFVEKRKRKNIRQLKKDALSWTKTAWDNKMDYEVTWLGISILQNPYDMILMQELIFRVRPDIIIETGIAHGGSLIYYSSLLTLLGKGKAIGIDVDIREHNRKLLNKHPMIKNIKMIEGNSIDENVIKQIKKDIKKNDKILVILDSDHRKKHVYKELIAYKDIVSVGSYIVVFDTFAPFLVGLENEKPYFKNNSAMDAVKIFIQKNRDRFVIDKSCNKFFVSSCPDGFIKRIK